MPPSAVGMLTFWNDLQHLKDLQPENRGGALAALTYGIIVERHCWHGFFKEFVFAKPVFQLGVVRPGGKAPKGRLESAKSGLKKKPSVARMRGVRCSPIIFTGYNTARAVLTEPERIRMDRLVPLSGVGRGWFFRAPTRPDSWKLDSILYKKGLIAISLEWNLVSCFSSSRPRGLRAFCHAALRWCRSPDLVLFGR